MKFTIFAIMAFLALGLTGCAHAFEEYGKQVGCIIAGNGCNSQGPAGAQGVAGANGTDGANGADGTNGTSCTVQAVAPGTVAPNGGAIITCGATSKRSSRSRQLARTAE